MKKHPELTVLLVVLALIIVLASSPFKDGITGHVSKDVTSKTGSTSTKTEDSWWSRLIASLSEDDAAKPTEGADAQSAGSDAPYDDNQDLYAGNFVEVEDDTAERDDSDEEINYGMNDQLSMYPDAEDNTIDQGQDACACDSSLSDSCSTTVNDRVNDLNDRVTDLENSQTSSSCGATPTLGAGCNIKVIDAEIMVIPGEKYDCNDACQNGQDKQCVFGMLTWTNDNDGFVTSSYLVPCTEERTPKMTQTGSNGKYYEKRITCACC